MYFAVEKKKKIKKKKKKKKKTLQHIIEHLIASL
jgi:hypothetical protein